MDKMKKLEMLRDNSRITGFRFLEGIVDDFVELHGDRTYGDDKSIIAGIAIIGDMPITVLVQEKGENLEDKIKRNFGMAHPEGYRKSLRMIKEAEKFGRPILTIIDTAGAYPGIESEERGQAQAIATMLYELSDIKVPVIGIVLSEGGSGGALALGICDYIYALEHSYYSVISPEGYAEILYKGKKEVSEIIDDLPIFSQDLLNLEVVDEVIKEPQDGLKIPVSNMFFDKVKNKIHKKFIELSKESKGHLMDKRYKRFRKFGK